jgi:hypothetical protein
MTKKAAQSSRARTKKSRLSSPEKFDVGSLVRLSYTGITGSRRGPQVEEFGDLTHLVPLDGRPDRSHNGHFVARVLFTSVGLVVSEYKDDEAFPIGWGHPSDRFLVVQFPEGRVVLEQNKLEWAE